MTKARSRVSMLLLPSLFAVMASAGVPATSIGQDADLTGVPVECQPNVRGRRGRPPLPGARGCAALDVIQTPGIFVDPLLRILADAGDEIAAGAAAGSPAAGDLAQLARGIAQIQVTLARAREKVAAAKLCRGAGLVSRAGTAISRLTRSAESKIARLGRGDADADAGDGTVTGGRQASLELFRGIFIRMGGTVDELRLILDGLCAGMGRPQSLRAVVVKVDDARRRLRLADGRVLGLHDGTRAGGLYAGAAVSARVRDLPGGDGLADSIDVDVAAGHEPATNAYNNCLELAVAPLQPFNPPFYNGAAAGTNGRAGLMTPWPGTEPYALHRLVAYEWPSVGFVFETGMRFAAAKRPCPSDFTDSEEQFHRYSLDLTLDQGTGTSQLASQLEPGDAPAPFNQGLQNPGAAIFTVTYKHQVCTLQPMRVPWITRLDTAAVRACDVATTECACDPDANYCPILPNWDDFDDVAEPYDCTVANVYKTETLNGVIVERGIICDATYTDLFFDIEDHVLDAFRTSSVASVAVESPINSVATTFWADGFAPAPPQETTLPDRYVASLITVSGGQAFGVYGWEPCPPVGDPGTATLESNCLFPEDPQKALQNTGAATASALRWPRIVGINNAKQFAYSCTLPAPLVRDTLKFCPGLYEYYRWPLAAGPWVIGQGNCACICPGCGATCCTHACGCTGQFAFDVFASSFTPVYAARGGKVVNVVGNATANCWQTTCSGPGGNWGNFVTIEHQDGTAASYLHMPFLLGGGVSVGQRVKRGEQIGYSDDTGNSAAPHLHFHEQVSKSNPNTQPMRFEIAVGLSQPQSVTCYIPSASDFVTATGVPPP